MRYAIVFLMSFWAQGIVLSAQSEPLSQRQKAAEDLIRTISKETATIMGSTDQEPQKKERLKALLENYFNLKASAKYVLKKYWDKAREEERQDYVNLFKQDIINSYYNLLNQYYKKESMEIAKSLPVPGRDYAFYVFSKAKNPNTGASIEVKWDIAHGKVLNATVGNGALSISDAKKKDYEQLVRQSMSNDSNQISFPSFLKLLKEKIQQRSSTLLNKLKACF